NNNTITLTLATVNGNAGSYGSATQVPAFTVNAKGLITSVSNIAFSIPVTSVAGRIGNVILSVSDVSGAAPLLSPALTGNPTAVTVSLSDNSNSIATTAYVKDQNYTVAPIVVSGDVLGTASGNAITLNLATSGVVSGTYGSATQVPALVVNAKGLVTSISNVAFSIPVTSVAGRIGNVILSVTDVANAVSNVAPTFTGLSTFVSGTFTATLGVAGATTLANMTANSGVFTTQLTSPTPVSGDNTSNVATTAYVTNMISYNSANVAITDAIHWIAGTLPSNQAWTGIAFNPTTATFSAVSLSNTVMSGNPSTILSTANATGNYAKIVSPALSGTVTFTDLSLSTGISTTTSASASASSQTYSTILSQITSVSAANLGSGTGIFSGATGISPDVTLYLKSIIGGVGISVSTDAETITLSAT
ncbi:unnamed protein product, partial [Sphagnum tenellum]